MRLDRFLSVAKIFKSRSLAALAIESSMVFIDNLLAKPAREIRLGQKIEIDTPRFYKKIEVISLPTGNISRKEAPSLYKLLEERIKD
jgi:ribosomal 50S subunit-recycling heat shock protein